nr:excalibur calcium-binding domain-containing protein [Sphingomonas crusticola]
MPTSWALAAIGIAFLLGRWTTSENASVPAAPAPLISPSAPAVAATPTTEESGTDQPKAIKEEPIAAQPTQQAVYYQNCSAARAAGAAPIRMGEPGYAPKLDRDGDGVACE